MSFSDIHQTSSDSVLVDPIAMNAEKMDKVEVNVKPDLLSIIEKSIKKEGLNSGRTSFQRIYQRLLVIFVIMLVLFLGVLAIIIQLCTVPLMLINKTMVLRWHGYLAGTIWTVLQFIHEDLSGLTISFTGLENIPIGENAFVISNHLSFSDYSIVHAIATRKKMVSFCKYFVKV